VLVTPALFVSHGAAFFTTSETDSTHQFLESFAKTVESWKPKAIVVVSAHFREAPLTTTGPGVLATVHDHPARQVYDFRWPARGNAALVARVSNALKEHRVGVDEDRGLDHGAWVPLSLLRPAADLPTLALSLHASNDPQVHISVGQALRVLRDEGVLLVGSGGVTHNQGVFREGFFARADVATPLPFSKAYDDWVTGVLTSSTGPARLDALAAFEEHPLARQAHPTTEHFLPLLVIAGAAQGDSAKRVHSSFQYSLSTSAFQFCET
jgi:4,5-DOPA dioxygenase extradiol